MLILDRNGNTSSRRLASSLGKPHHNRTSSNDFASHLAGASSCPVDSLRQNLASIIEEHGSSRRSLSESILTDTSTTSGSVSLRKRFNNEEELTCKITRNSDDDDSLLQVSPPFNVLDELSLHYFILPRLCNRGTSINLNLFC